MSDLVRHTNVGVCHCTRCTLTGCGAIDRRWRGWRDAEIAGEIRALLYLVVGREPVISPDVIGVWAGCIAWFDRLGIGLTFEEDA
jgi:hypothetical protein